MKLLNSSSQYFFKRYLQVILVPHSFKFKVVSREPIVDNSCNVSYETVDKPTRYRINQEPSVLDLILVNDKNRVSKIIFDNPLGSSDHCVLKFDYRCYIDYESIISEKYNYFKGDYDKLRNELDCDWQKLLSGKCTEDMIDIMERLLESMDTRIPKSKRGKRKGKMPLSNDTIKCIRRKHRL